MSDQDEMKRLTEQFKLIQHPAGGMYVQKWKGDRTVTFMETTAHSGARSTGTSIYFLLPTPHFITWHKLLSDELMYWHAGGTLKIHFIDKEGNHSTELLGNAVTNPKCQFQVHFPHDTWYACEVLDREYVFYSASVAPGFEFEDWTEGKRESMLKSFPQHKELIEKLTKA